MLKRWTEYSSAFLQKRQDCPETYEPIHFEETEPEPLLEEVNAAVNQLNCGKSPGLDNIPTELLKHCGDGGKMALHYLCKEI